MWPPASARPACVRGRWAAAIKRMYMCTLGAGRTPPPGCAACCCCCCRAINNLPRHSFPEQKAFPVLASRCAGTRGPLYDPACVGSASGPPAPRNPNSWLYMCMCSYSWSLALAVYCLYYCGRHVLPRPCVPVCLFRTEPRLPGRRVVHGCNLCNRRELWRSMAAHISVSSHGVMCVGQLVQQRHGAAVAARRFGSSRPSHTYSTPFAFAASSRPLPSSSACVAACQVAEPKPCRPHMLPILRH